MRLSYDLHMHSCLSPCGSEDMTPNNLVNMAALLGLDLIALTDHNSARNLPAACRVAEACGVTVVPGVEACTSEEVHMLCLFETLEGALGFGEEIYKYLPPIRNKPEIFGEQMVRNEQDEPVDEEPLLLINALTLSIDRLLPLAREYGGEAIPAHANKSTTSIMSSLGFIPPDYGFACIELNPPDERFAFQGRWISDSDAHYLEQIHEPEFFLELPEKSPRAVVDYIRGR